MLINLTIISLTKYLKGFTKTDVPTYVGSFEGWDD